MNIHGLFSKQLPTLRRYAHAVSGNQATGDAQIATLMNAVIRDPGALPTSVSENIGLYRLLTRIMAATETQAPDRSPIAIGAPRSWIQQLPLLERQALLLFAVERMSHAEIAAVIEKPLPTVSRLIDTANTALTQAQPNFVDQPVDWKARRSAIRSEFNANIAQSRSA